MVARMLLAVAASLKIARDSNIYNYEQYVCFKNEI